MNADLDRIDTKMLRLLQKNGRLTNAELATLVDVSPATCHRRTQRLFDEGSSKLCGQWCNRKWWIGVHW
jgi:Lrp/AsnC family leucine-responsive transcriptional regulator